MAISNDDLLRAAAAFKRTASREFDKAVKALIDLVWAKGTPTADFLFENDPELDSEANAILRGLSDALVANAKARAEAVIRAAFADYDMDEAWDYVDDVDEATPLFWRFDMQGSHLKELLEVWIALAVVNGIGRSELRVLISRYLNNPFASPLWRSIPKNALRWGRGYARNILDQIAVIGQNAIIGAVRYAEWEKEKANGAVYYIRRRGSSYNCDECQSIANRMFPISVPFYIPHSRCCCYPEYFYV